MNIYRIKDKTDSVAGFIRTTAPEETIAFAWQQISGYVLNPDIEELITHLSKAGHKTNREYITNISPIRKNQ